MGIRSQIRNRNRFVSEPQGGGKKRFIWVCLASFGVHLLLFSSIFWFHDFDSLKPQPRVVRVDLVSFDPGPVGGPSEPDATVKEPSKPKDASVSVKAKPIEAKPAEPAPIPVLKPDLSLKSKPKNIKKLMAERKKKEPIQKKKPQKTVKPKTDPKKEMEKAREALAKKIEDENQKKIDQALKRMQAAIAEKEKAKGNPKGAGSGPGTGTGVGKKGSDPVLLYQMVIASAIRQNWVFSDVMARMDKDLECKVLIKILKSGEIRDIIYETRSGNQYLDESVKKAIRRSSPLPELPLALQPSYDIGFVFSPKGLK